MVSQVGLEVDEEKIASVRKALSPTNKNGLRRFLGMTGLYLKFIPTYAKVVAPLTRYLKGDQEDQFDLDAESLTAHDRLKVSITSAPCFPCQTKTAPIY